MSTPAGDDLVGSAHINVNANTDPALRALRQFSRDVDGRLRDTRGRFVSESALINRSLVGAAGGGDRFNLSLRTLTNIASAAGGVLRRIGVGVGAVGAAAGTAAPLLAGIVTTLENIAPAGAVAVTGMLAVQQATVAIKLGMVGVEDAIGAALDPSKAEQFNEALKKLAPNARAFAVQVRELQPAFQSLQQGVQNRIFAGFATELERLSTSVLPIVRTNLNATADTLNKMALGASGAARELAANGTLGQAMAGANTGLSNLRTIPGQVVTALGQLAAAGAPAFDRLTAGAANVATTISDRLNKAFESGALTNAVNNAIDLIGQLGTVAGNIASIFGSVFNAAQTSGGGLIGTLTTITGTLKTAFASPAVQQGLTALFTTMGTLATTAAPLLGQALSTIAPVLAQLGPPVQRLIENLGAALAPVIENLGPVLTVAADAVGKLLDALSPILPVIGDLVASLLPPLVPAIAALGDVFTQAAPVVKVLATTLQTALAPIIAQLPAIITPLANTFSMLARTLLPVLGRLIVALAPSLAQMGVAFGRVMAALGPLITAFGSFIGGALTKLMPIINTVVGVIGRLAAVFTGHLANVLTTVVVPAIRTISSLLQGDFSGAWEGAKSIVSGAINTMNSLFQGLPGKLFSALASLAGKLKSRAVEAGSALVGAIRDKVSAAIDWLRGVGGRAFSALADFAGKLRDRAMSAGGAMVNAIRENVTRGIQAVAGLPGKAVSALGDLGRRLYSAGRDLIRGMINGVRDMAGSLVSAAKDVVGSAIDGAKNLLGISSPSKVFAEIGRDAGRGMVIGLNGAQAKVDEAATRMAGVVAGAFSGVGAGVNGRVSVGADLAAMPALGVGTVRTGLAAAAPVTVNLTVNLTNAGIISSQREMDSWLTASLDRLRLQGRLPMGAAV